MRGSIERRVAKNGAVTWTCRVDVPGADGKRTQKRLSAPTRKELEAMVAKVLHGLTTGSYVEPTKTTVGDYLSNHWLPAIESTVRPATVARYRQMVKGHLDPGLGKLVLAKLTAAHLQRFYADRLAAGLSPTSVNNFHMVLHRALDQAIKWKMIGINPCDGAEPPRRARTEMKTWDAEQVKAFLTATEGHPLHALYRLALLTGMRRGELLALRWQDIDLKRGALAIRRTLTRDVTDHWMMGEPKTAAGRRAIALPASCVAALKRHQTAQKARMVQYRDIWQETGLVFDRGDGAMLHPNVPYETFRRLAAEHGLPLIRFHDLRHTSATMALAGGIHPKIVSERLGHSSISMTLDRYSHVSMSMQQEAADRLDQMAGGA
jgi:integrase